MNRLKDLRAERAMTQKQLASMLNCAASAISKYELEQLGLDAKTIIKLCDIFGVTADYLLCRSNSPSAAMTDDEANLLRAYRVADRNDRAIVELALDKYKEKHK